MRPYYFILHHLHNATNICTRQTLTVGVDLNIDGSLAENGVADISRDGLVLSLQAQQVVFGLQANEAGNSVEIVGTDVSGYAISELLTFAGGPGAEASVLHYATVTRILALDTFNDETDVGWNEAGEAISSPKPVNWRQAPSNITLAAEPYPDAVMTGSDELASVEYTHDDVQDTKTFASPSEDAHWIPQEGLINLSAAADIFVSGPIRAVRGVIAAGEHTSDNDWRFKVIQGNTN